MTTAPTISSITASGGAWAGVTWSHDSSQDVNDANTCMKVYEQPASQQAPGRGFALIYYKTGPKAGKQYINVDEGNPANTDSPNSIENVTQSTGGQSGTAEVEYTTGDVIKMWVNTFPQQELVQVTTDSTWNFTSGSSAFSTITFLADGSSLPNGWYSQGLQYYNQTNTPTGVQTFVLGTAGGTMYTGHEIAIDFQANQYVVTDPGSSTPVSFYVGSSDPSSNVTDTTVNLVNTADYLYISELSTSSTHWVKLNLNGPGSGSGSGPNTLSGGSGPEIKDIVFTKASDTSLTVSFNWQNLNNAYVFYQDPANAGSVNIPFTTVSLGGQGNSGNASTVIHGLVEGHKIWIADTSPIYIFKKVNFSTFGTTLTVSTFLAGATNLNNDADLRYWDNDLDAWSYHTGQRYINWDGTEQTVTISPYVRGTYYYVYDRSTGNEYGSRFNTPGRKGRHRNFW